MIKLLDKIKYGPSFQAAQVEEKALPLSPVCVSLEGRTVLFLSDVHLSNRFPASAVEKLLAQIDFLQPDLLLLGGDYGESAEWQFQFFRMLSQLHPPLGMYGVLGNNDYECFPNDLNPLIDAAEQAGVRLLVDQTVRIDTGSGAIALAGLDEIRQAKPLRQPLFTDQDASSLRILLAHYPQSIGRYANSGFAAQPHLAMAGHTHGGQFRLFGLTPYSIGFEYRFMGERLPAVRGWKDMGDTKLLVSPGLGTSRIPIRINADPTIHLIRFTK